MKRQHWFKLRSDLENQVNFLGHFKHLFPRETACTFFIEQLIERKDRQNRSFERAGRYGMMVVGSGRKPCHPVVVIGFLNSLGKANQLSFTTSYMSDCSSSDFDGWDVVRCHAAYAWDWSKRCSMRSRRSLMQSLHSW